MKLNRGEPGHPHWRTPFTAKEKAKLWLGLGACSIVMGVVEWAIPSNPPFAGRWGWLHAAAHDALGIHGVAILWLASGMLLAVGAGLAWPRTR